RRTKVSRPHQTGAHTRLRSAGVRLMPRFSRPARTSAPKTALSVDRLEERDCPSATALDLTRRGAEATANGAVFRQYDAAQPSAYPLNTFVRVQDSLLGSTEQGYNTDARPTQFDEATDPAVTHSVKVADLPLVMIGGTAYREVLLDVSEPALLFSKVSLDELRVYVGGA